MNELKTKKIRREGKNKVKLWEQFDTEILDKKNVECVYTNNGLRENCDCCTSSLVISDEGFQTCTNKKCGIFYTDILDQTSEWRYYGAEDTSGSNPTDVECLLIHYYTNLVSVVKY